MSDFFTRLAERVLGLALTIQPIKPSLFAPDLEASGETLLEITEESTGSTGTQPGNGMPARRPASSRTPSQAHYAEAHTVQLERSQVEQYHPPASAIRQSANFTSAETPVNGANSLGNLLPVAQHGLRHTPTGEFSANSMQARGFTPLTGEIESAAQQSSTHVQSSVTTQIRSASRNDLSLPPHPEQGRSNNVSDMNVEAVEASLSPASLQSGTRRERAARPVSPVPSASSHEQTLHRRVIHGERSRRGTQLPASIASAQVPLEAATPEPAIQVTIGRVEVRAVSAPAATTRAQQQSARPPAMSLDEYLHRQEGGRR